MTSFSERGGYAVTEAPIVIRDDAPATLRQAVWGFAAQCGFDGLGAWETILDTVPQPAFDSGTPLKELARNTLFVCEWYEVYDLIEVIAKSRYCDQLKFARYMNDYFRKNGYAWHLVNGSIELKAPEAVQETLGRATESLQAKGLSTAANELHEALRDLSRRPDPDSTGAIQHAAAALECVARELTGDKNATLGQIIGRYPNLFPKPLDSAAEKIWGYASNSGRHLSEGGTPTRATAQLVTGLTAALAAYISDVSASED